MFGNLATLAPNDDEDELPRIPPPPATPLDFPSCNPHAKSPNELDRCNDIVKLFSSILRTGPSQSHLEALNVDLENNVPLEGLLPAAYLPSSAWLEDPSKLQASQGSPNKTPPNETLSNGGPLPGHEAFYTRARELLLETETAFRSVKYRQSATGSGTRVLHFRRFYENLRSIADYWDTSLDNYSKSSTTQVSVAVDIDALRSEAQRSTDSSSSNTSEEAKAEETYTGRRKDTGKNMPGKYREETIFAFVEPIAWSFRCRLENARMQPKLKMKGMILPLPHNMNIYRTPEDSRQARRGILEGPLAGVFCRDQISFRRPEDDKGEGKQEILDLLREVGLMLMLAQKRAREGKQEEAPGNEQWWATKPRWGGGPGGDVGISEEDAPVEDLATPSTPEGGPRKRPRKLDRAALWKEMKPPSTMWEKGITYATSGGVRGGKYDDIYLFSSVNHHISILHLHIHHKYTEDLPNQPAPRGGYNSSFVPPSQQQPSYRLTMRRSKWFDLLSPDGRMQAMRGMWAVMGWLMRRADEDGDGERQDEEMTS